MPHVTRTAQNRHSTCHAGLAIILRPRRPGLCQEVLFYRDKTVTSHFQICSFKQLTRGRYISVLVAWILLAGPRNSYRTCIQYFSWFLFMLKSAPYLTYFYILLFISSNPHLKIRYTNLITNFLYMRALIRLTFFNKFDIYFKLRFLNNPLLIIKNKIF